MESSHNIPTYSTSLYLKWVLQDDFEFELSVASIIELLLLLILVLVASWAVRDLGGLDLLAGGHARTVAGNLALSKRLILSEAALESIFLQISKRASNVLAGINAGIETGIHILILVHLLLHRGAGDRTLSRGSLRDNDLELVIFNTFLKS